MRNVKKGDRMSILDYEEDWAKRYKLKSVLQEVCSDDETVQIYYAKNESDAFKYAEEHHIDVAFISWDVRQGLFLTEKLKDRVYRLNVVIMSEAYQYEEEFWKWHLSGYIVGDVTQEKVLRELDNLRYA